MPRFIDTNVLLYAVEVDRSDSTKTAIAREIVGQPDLALSAQVVGEFCNQATHPARSNVLTGAQAAAVATELDRYPILEITLDLILEALAIKVRYGISYWDAQIIAAAKALGCAELLSEDLQDGQDFGGVVVVNPFRGSRPAATA